MVLIETGLALADDIGAEFADEVDAVHTLAMSYVVDCPEAELAASVEINSINRLMKQIDEAAKRISAPMREALSELNRQATARKAPLVEAKTAIVDAVASYRAELRARHEAEERAAREAAAEERRRLAEEASAAREQGDDVAAEVIEQAAAVMPAPVVAAPARTPGLATHETWSAEVTDIRELARGVADGCVPVDAVMPNMPMLNKSARALHTALNWPGVRAVKTVTERATGKGV